MSEKPRQRLDSWKAIADFLGRDVRTAIRWEKERGLPVHRLPGGKRQAVFAYGDELDLWMRSQGATALAAELPLEPASISQGADPQGRRTTALGLLAVAALVLLTLTLVVAYYTLRAPSSRSTRGFPREAPVSFSVQQISLPFAAGLAVGDLNRDTHLDLVVTPAVEGEAIAVLLGRGDGTFAPPALYQAGSVPSRATIADLDGDGVLDVAVSNLDSGSVSVLTGGGSGTFAAPEEYPVGKQALGLVSADFNRDGSPDLAVALFGGNAIAILINRGKSFATARTYAVGDRPTSLTAADLNHDGYLDIAVANSGEGSSEFISVLLGKGDGTFQPAVAHQAGSWPMNVSAGDFNGDGRTDLVVSGASLWLLRGNGDGSFQPPVEFGTPRGQASARAADVDRDGALDVVRVNAFAGNIEIFRGRGQGTFVSEAETPVGRYPYDVAFGDFNEDGRTDIAVTATHAKTLAVLLNNTPR